MKRVYYIAVPGTHASDDPSEWWQWGSPWARFAESHGLFQFNPSRPVIWSRDLDDVFWEGSRRYEDWKAGARLLVAIVEHLAHHPVAEEWSLDPPLPPVNIIAHSYGLYVALIAATLGLTIENLISVGTPIRNDLAPWVQHAKPHIGYWLHLYDKQWDMVATAGQFLDGRWSFDRRARWKVGNDILEASQNAAVPGISHTKLFTDPTKWDLWQSQGYFDILRGGGLGPPMREDGPAH